MALYGSIVSFILYVYEFTLFVSPVSTKKKRMTEKFKIREDREYYIFCNGNTFIFYTFNKNMYSSLKNDKMKLKTITDAVIVLRRFFDLHKVKYFL